MGQQLLDTADPAEPSTIWMSVDYTAIINSALFKTALLNNALLNTALQNAAIF